MTPGRLPAYDQVMRYAQRGGYTPAEQQRRGRLRMEAAGRFARGDGIGEIARDLRVTEGSVRRWATGTWQDGGPGAPRSKGPVSRERLSPQQWARLELELRKGPLAHGFANDQRWTLGRIKTLIGKLFHVGYTVEGTAGRPRSRCARPMASLVRNAGSFLPLAKCLGGVYGIACTG